MTSSKRGATAGIDGKPADRLWTVHHAFTVVRAVVEARAVVGLALQTATEGMIAPRHVAPRSRLRHMIPRPTAQCGAGEIGGF